jgi:hypothetical protein
MRKLTEQELQAIRDDVQSMLTKRLGERLAAVVLFVAVDDHRARLFTYHADENTERLASSLEQAAAKIRSGKSIAGLLQ